MGLDIVSYSKTIRKDLVDLDDNGQPVDPKYMRVTADTDDRFSSGVTSGSYVKDGSGEYYRGGYSDYILLREGIHAFEGYPESGPTVDFWDFNASGIIGPDLSELLYHLMIKNQDLAINKSLGFYSVYKNYMLLFKNAIDGGLIYFDR